MPYFLHVEEGNEKDLEAAVAMQGPISVIVDASHNIFRVNKFTFYVCCNYFL